MIIAQLMGGLGNQMFQYAMARRVAIKNKSQLKLDINSGFDCCANTPRKYELNVFDIRADILTQDEINRIQEEQINSTNFFNRLFNRKISDNRRYITEKRFRFDPQMLNLSGNLYIKGFWQSEKYFADIQEIIREDFRLKIESSAENTKLIEGISDQKNAVSLHIRRGDYVSSPSTNEYHGICSLDYYRMAIERIKADFPDIYIYIFTDDPDWAKKNFKSKSPFYIVDRNSSNKAYEDLKLMIACRHHIIANSTFSWWGAWLGNKTNQIVVAPKRWFNKKIETIDLIPNTWVQI